MPRLLMFAFGVCILGTLYSLIDSGVWFGANQVDFFNAVAGINAVKDQSLGSWTNPTVPFAWINALLTMVFWNYPYLDSSWGLILKMVVLWPCTIGVIIYLFQQVLLPVISLVVTAISSLARTFIP